MYVKMNECYVCVCVSCEGYMGNICILHHIVLCGMERRKSGWFECRFECLFVKRSVSFKKIL